ncbi:hypothetical protein [Caulobacter sp. UNC358MFTsu5.1]|uniref:hypothetical protein n=1 Tax=Caulobacter sp. UNC358MFTsu5.1 TaxID=1449049 RepID=UPI0004A71719|nr:hypothetical protein [Caulobacter sp. UNC358MFTsu5.1]
MSDHPDTRETTRWTALLELLGIHRITAQEIRAETMFLGNRHQGRIAEGARLELKASGISAYRVALLRAVIRAVPARDAAGADR